MRTRPWPLLLVLPLAFALADEPPKPLGRDLPGEVMPDRAWDFVHLHLDLVLDPASGEVSGAATHTIRPLGKPDTWLRLHQRALDVTAVRVDGQEIRGWRLGENTLDIPLPAGGGERKVQVDWKAKPQTGLHYRGGKGRADAIVEVWSQGEGEDNQHWFPGWDYPNDRFTYSSTITAPSRYVAASNGVLKGKEAKGDATTWSYALDRAIPNYLVAVVVGEYDVVAQDGPVPLEHLVPKGLPEDDTLRTFGVVGDQMTYFGELLAEPYPYPVHRQVLVSRFLYGAMENATLVTYDDHYLRHDEVVRGHNTESVVAHELAHHWFGDLLTCYGWRELWLNEGFASFYAGRWLEHRYGAEVWADEVRDWLRGASRDPYPLSPTAITKEGDRNSGAVYSRGAAVLQMLRVHLGDEVFDRGIRRYVAENKDSFVESGRLRRAFEEESGEHLGWLFDQYVTGAGVPKLSSSWSWREGQLTVSLSQQTEGAPFHVPVEVEIGTDTGTIVREIWAGGGKTDLVIDTKEPPSWVAVDPRCGVLATWEQEQPTAAWIAQLESEHACARLAAIERLGDGEAASAAIEALAKQAGDAKHAPEYRREAVQSLGDLGEGAAPFLESLASDPEVRVREAAVRQIGTLPTAPARVALLEKAARTDDAWVRSTAIRALGDLDVAAGRKAARAALQAKPDERGWVHEAALDVLADHGEPSDLAAALGKTGAGQGRGVRHGAARAAVRIFARLDADEQEKRRAKLSDALIPFLEDPDLHARWLGADLLGKVGDDRAEAALRSAAAASTSDSFRRSALDAASEIRHRKEQPADEDARQKDLERLEQEIDAMEKRLKRLEEWR
jgi:aminopeptidase N